MSICKPPEQYLNKLRERYRKARKKEHGRILDEDVATVSYHRKHAVATNAKHVFTAPEHIHRDLQLRDISTSQERIE